MKTLLIYLGAIAVLDLAAVYFGKMYFLTNKGFFMALCALCLGLTGIFFSLSLKYGEMAIVNVIWISVSIVLATLLGVFYFNENISTFQYIGMGFILLGMIFIFAKPVGV
jgi:multidrug transporter EmrE-like cation transporter